MKKLIHTLIRKGTMKRIIAAGISFCAVLLSVPLVTAAAEQAIHKPAAVHTDTATVGHHHGQDGESDEKTLEGEIIDITCYIRHDSKGPDHLKCAEYCATLGMPFGFLEDKTHKIYLILPDGHENPVKPYKKHLGKKVKVKALLYTMGGMTGFEIVSIEEL
jgi:hypothetical protein